MVLVVHDAYQLLQRPLLHILSGFSQEDESEAESKSSSEQPLLLSFCLSQIVEEEALIKNNNTCKDFLIEAMKYHLMPADQRHLIKTDRTRPRTPISIPKVNTYLHRIHTSLHEHAQNGSNANQKRCCRCGCAHVQVMIVVGGQAPKAIRSVECYDFQEDRWYQVADLPSRRCRAGESLLALVTAFVFNYPTFGLKLVNQSTS